MLNTICVAFPLVGMQSSIQDGTLCENVSQLEALTVQLARIKLHLRCLIGFYSKFAPESSSALVIVNFNLIEGFWLYLKIAVSACPAGGSDKPKTFMPGSCNTHARNLPTAK